MASTHPAKILTVLMDSEILHLNERIKTRGRAGSDSEKTNEDLRPWNLNLYLVCSSVYSYTIKFTNVIIILLTYATVEQRLDVTATL
jgi:hypothetical protein